MRDAFERRRNLVITLAREIPGLEINEPAGAFYLFPGVKAYLGKRYRMESADGSIAEGRIDSDSDLCMYLLEHAHVATVAGSAFCMPGYIRLSYAAADDLLVQAMERIRVALSKLTD